ncbi:RNA polymerase III transcription factor IIIC subunit-domain-containing protein [Phellopilus nigrolimitatus]|nr:RNA polymerase III transcription factor IIIC subunit-domain-containing protein [Phellopilus nigrolimitatus]
MSSAAGPSSSTDTSRQATEHLLQSDAYYSIEFPGYVEENSVPNAVQRLGGQAAIERAFKRNATKVESFLELSWRPEQPFAHPIPGSVVQSNNILLKVTKRRRKRKEVEGMGGTEGDFLAEAVGVITKTARFRGMADFQYSPDASDPAVLLRAAMDRMDVDYIRKYAIPPEKEDYALPVGLSEQPQAEGNAAESVSNAPVRSNLRLIPPPLFSRQTIPQIYNYKANNMSVVTTFIDSETGVEKKRLINKARWKGYGPASITFSEKTTPDKPPGVAQEAQEDADVRILTLLRQKFEERPIWTRNALNNQFSPADAREIQNSKCLIPLVCYVFVDGPWRDTLLRFGYDPREDSSARFYQRIYFRNINHPFVRPSVVARRQEQRDIEKQTSTSTSAYFDPQNTEQEQPGNEPPSHIFDGIHLTKETAAYQLCDIVDPMIKEMVEDEAGVRDECNERDGWYTTHALESIKAVLRHKFFSLLEGHIPSDEECRALLNAEPGSRPVGPRDAHRWHAGKHNMAKGAVPPEDAAAVRLRAALDSTAKGATGRGR